MLIQLDSELYVQDEEILAIRIGAHDGQPVVIVRTKHDNYRVTPQGLQSCEHLAAELVERANNYLAAR